MRGFVVREARHELHLVHHEWARLSARIHQAVHSMFPHASVDAEQADRSNGHSRRAGNGFAHHRHLADDEHQCEEEVEEGNQLQS